MDFNKLVELVTDCTDRNDHNTARHLISVEYNFCKLAKAYEGITAIQDAFGYLPNGVYETRYELDQQLKYKMMEKLEVEDFDKLWGSL